jgi:hypothetical protein
VGARDTFAKIDFGFANEKSEGGEWRGILLRWEGMEFISQKPNYALNSKTGSTTTLQDPQISRTQLGWTKN